MKYFKVLVIALLLVFLTSCGGEDENYITSAVVNSEGHLVLTYSDGTTLDQGLVVPEVVDVETYQVIFYNTEGNIVDTQLIEHGEDAFGPILDLPDHHVFDEWDTDFTNVTGDINVNPLWHEETFTVSFHDAEITTPDVTEVTYGEFITLPNPIVPGKHFIGWYDGDGPYDSMINMKIQIHNDMDLFARYEDIVYTVTYHTDGGTETFTQEALYGDMLMVPEEPIKEDYFFNGWYYDREEIIPVEFDTMIIEDQDIYISWIQFEYTLYDSMYSPDDETITIHGVIGKHNIIHIPSMIDGIEVGRINSNAFRYNEASEVYLPDTVYLLQNSAFADMPNLTSIVIPDSVTNLDDRVFNNCTSLSDVTLSANISSIGSYSFQNTAIESIVVPEGVTHILYGAFMDTPLTSIELPSTLTRIYEAAFQNTLLTSMELPEGMENLGSLVFADNPNLTSITLPETIYSFGTQIFMNTPNLTSITLSETNPYLELIDGAIYSEDLTYLMLYLPYITATSFTVPETVMNIGTHSFYGNPYLETIELPDTLGNSNIYGNFDQMESLQAINVYDTAGSANIASENGVVYNYSFQYLLKYPMGKEDTTYTVNTSTLLIYPYAFMNNTYLNSVILPNGLVEIYDYAFSDCTNLSAINLPTTLGNIHSFAFYNVDGITQIDLPASVRYLGFQSFAEMDNLSTLNLNEGLLNIPDYFIANSNNITSIHIPSTTTSIYTNAFVDTYGLTSLTIESTNLYYAVYNNALYNKSFIHLYGYPSGLTSQTLYVHSSTERIYADFGSNPHLKIIDCGTNVERFYGNVYDLPNLDTIIFRRPSTSSIVIMNYRPTEEHPYTVFVRSDSLDDYINNNEWDDHVDYLKGY